MQLCTQWHTVVYIVKSRYMEDRQIAIDIDIDNIVSISYRLHCPPPPPPPPFPSLPLSHSFFMVCSTVKEKQSGLGYISHKHGWRKHKMDISELLMEPKTYVHDKRPLDNLLMITGLSCLYEVIPHHHVPSDFSGTQPGWPIQSTLSALYLQQCLLQYLQFALWRDSINITLAIASTVRLFLVWMKLQSDKKATKSC